MTVDLFGTRPRRAPRKLAHVYDAYARDGNQVCQMKCDRCGHLTGWLIFPTVTAAKEGVPCPTCNPETPNV